MNEKKYCALRYARSRRGWMFVFALVSSCSLAAFDGSCARALALNSHELLRFLHLVVPWRARESSRRPSAAFRVMFGWGMIRALGHGGGDRGVDCVYCAVY